MRWQHSSTTCQHSRSCRCSSMTLRPSAQRSKQPCQQLSQLRCCPSGCSWLEKVQLSLSQPTQTQHTQSQQRQACQDPRQGALSWQRLCGLEGPWQAGQQQQQHQRQLPSAGSWQQQRTGWQLLRG